MKTREHRETHGEVPLEEIRHEAYLLWKQEGCPSGRELDHWLAAKELVKHRQGSLRKPDEARELVLTEQ